MAEENDYNSRSQREQKIKKLEKKVIQLEYRIEALEENNL